MPHIRSEVISGKYAVQYIFAAGATAAVDPLINAIGVGWTFTICELSGSFQRIKLLTHITRCLLRHHWRCQCLDNYEMGTGYTAMGGRKV